MPPKKPRTIILSIICIAVALNIVTFCVAFPETFKPESATVARDFSAYYIGEWRLFHNPADIYVGGARPGDYTILPKPQTFKYTPSFLILLAPVLTLSYQDALVAFDVLQLALVPVLAFFVYKLVKDKKPVLGAVAAVIVLIDPLPSPLVERGVTSLLGYRLITFNLASFSSAYYCSYVLANAHVLQTVLLVGALFFGFTKKPWVSALLFTFSIFDPRAALLALPLLLWYNRQSIVKFITGSAVFLAASNLPFFFYHGIGFAFLSTEFNGQIMSQLYQYDWIPIYSVAALTIIEFINVVQSKQRSNPVKNKV